MPLLEKNRYACFSEPETSTNEDPENVPRRELKVPPEQLSEVYAVSKIQGSALSVVPVTVSLLWVREMS